jgi:cytochrome c oxidase cbb3-type subunit 3
MTANIDNDLKKLIMSLHKCVEYLKKTALLLLLPGASALAKGGGVAPANKPDTNWLEIMLIFTAVILLAVIWGLGQSLLTFSRHLTDKEKRASKIAILVIGLFGINGSALAQTEEAVASVAKAANYGGMSQLQFYLLSGVIMLEVIVILFLAFMARRTYRALMGLDEEKVAEAKEASRWVEWWNQLDQKFFTKAIPVEQEADVMLDHDYDGIRELDNALPPWWKYGFYVTVVVAFIYMFYFHIFGTGMNPDQEYAAEMAEGRKQEEIYKAKTKDQVDENNITLADASGIAAGKALYNQSCVACHAADGGGGIGPNLTDNNWIHGGSLNDIYKTIKLGYPEKGMQSWQSVYSPIQMKNLTSFVKSLKGTKPTNPKEAQGEPFTE